MRIAGGAQRGRRIHPPADRSIRPALERIREAVFNVIGERVEGARVLDLFAGVGSFGLEAISRGARSVRFVDASKGSIAILKRNVRELGYEPFATVDCADALTSPAVGRNVSSTGGSSVDGSYDLVFLDPPFPFFRNPQDVDAIFRRVRELLDACEGGWVILRQPSSYRDDPPFPPSDSRKYGDSRVLYFTSEPSEPRDEDG